jgi:hypothetical protein
MDKKTLYCVTAIWFLLVLVSLWRDEWVINLAVAVVSACLGGWVLYRDPHTADSKRTGYKVIGFVFLAFGVVRLTFALLGRFFL